MHMLAPLPPAGPAAPPTPRRRGRGPAGSSSRCLPLPALLREASTRVPAAELPRSRPSLLCSAQGAASPERT